MTGNAPEYLAVGNAAAIAGIPERTLRYWITSGKLPATTGSRGKLVRLDDVQRVAALAGRDTVTSTTPPAMPEVAAEVASDVAATTLVSDQARTQLEAIRDEWLLPLVEQIREQAERIGRLEAERDALLDRLEALQATQTAQDGPHGAGTGARDPGDLVDDPVTAGGPPAPWWRFWRR